jgi:RimJ/RimL family protein N-acetyltransferase
MQLPHTVLQRGVIRLEPLAEDHLEGLRAACAADQEVWSALYPVTMLGEGFDENIASYRRTIAAGATQTYVILVDGVVAGMSSLLSIDHANSSLEIGGTYYAPAFRGGAVNPTAKLLLMGRAFGGGAVRVQLKVDALNKRSRAAVLKLGAQQEGILRQDRLTWTGRVRDTVVFSVLTNEWPGVKAGLEVRIGSV